MKKKIYVPPDAQFVMFVPDHALAADENSAWWSFWNWGAHGEGSVTGTVNVWEDKGDSPAWIYQGSGEDKPY